MDKSFMHQSLHALHCPQCGNLYTNSKIGVLQESDANILATITCAKCQHQSIVTLSLGTQAATSTPMTDLKINEIPLFSDHDPISSNDLIDIHQHLKKTKGNFYQEFQTALNSHTTTAPKPQKRTRKSKDPNSSD